MYLDLKCAFCGCEGGCQCYIDQEDGTVIDLDAVYVPIPQPSIIAQPVSAEANLHLRSGVRVVDADPLIVRPDLKSQPDGVNP